MLDHFCRKLYSKALHGLMMLKNRHIDRHIVVFESDDWGSIRMPSLETLNRLQKQNIKLALPHSYDRFDTLASNDDLEMLLEVLSSVKDSNGNPAIITLNTCVANPDFERIKMSGFQTYYYEPFTETLKRYPHHDRSFNLWKEGISQKLFRPQFHGREHLNPQKWLRYLQQGNEAVISAFYEGCFSVGVPSNNRMEFFLESYRVDSAKECEFVRQSIKEGLALFERIFGFRSESMIAPCYTWDDFIEEESAENGIRCLQGGYIQGHSPWQRKLGNQITGHYFGEINTKGQCYIIRNCTFEPSSIASDNANSCIAEITKAFSNHLPAIISCHRVNFIGDLCSSNRDRNLKEFKLLLNKIVGQFPDVEFLSSDELGKEILNGNIYD